MNPQRITARHYRTWQELDIELPDGCCAILGPNGAGKSSIINVIDLALFGGRDLKRHLARGSGTDLELSLEFEHGETLYRIRRGYDSRGSGKSWVEFLSYNVTAVDPGAYEPGETEQGWRPLTQETAKATDELIRATIGLSRETFRASAFLAQSDGAAFTEADPRVRKELLAEILGLSTWDDLLDLARGDLRDEQKEAERSTARLEVMEEARLRAVQATAGLADATAELLLIDTRLEELPPREDADAVIEDARVKFEHLRNAEAELVGFQREQARVDAQLAAAQSEQQRISEMQASVDTAEMERLAKDLPLIAKRHEEQAEIVTKRHVLAGRLEEAKRDLQRSGREIERVSAAVKDAQARAEALSRPGAACPTCGQPTVGEAHERAAEAVMREVQALLTQFRAAEKTRFTAAADAAHTQVKYDELPPADEELGAKLAAAQRAHEYMLRLEERLAHAETLKARIDGLRSDAATVGRQVENTQARCDRLAAELRDLKEPVTDMRNAIAERITLTQRRHDHEVAAERAQVAADEVRRQDEEMTLEREALTTRMRTIAILDVLVKAYGRDGIPAMLVERIAVPQIEAEANRVLAELASGITVELRTQRATQKGDIKETLDIIVETETGEALYEDFSGGERTRLNLALRLGLARLLAGRRDADVQVLAIDEPEHLDEEGMARLASVLLGLRDEFAHIILISHVPALADAFDQTISVEKTIDGVSSISGAA